MSVLPVMTVVTRFAPSPTGFLHIGGARTALFNWLYARHHGGRFLLRVEDTDRARSTDAAVHAIFDGLKWLGLDWDDEAVSQAARVDRHREVAEALLAAGCAYPCYASPDELTEMRERARAEGRPMRYDGRWRDRDPSDAPAGVNPVIRFKAPRDGVTRIADHVQGEVTVANDQLDDMVLLRADGTPTYMLAVVVDDHDMEITDVIRGDDHLTNAFRQSQLYVAMGWTPPAFAHVPLIHGPDGAKLSKRHGALGVDSYRDDGFLPEALCNYLLRLGWAHGDDEIIDRQQAIQWFGLNGVGRSPARFDGAKLTSLNAHYLRIADDSRLTDLVLERLAATYDRPLVAAARDRIIRGMPSLKIRAKTLIELAESASVYVSTRPIAPTARAVAVLDAPALDRLRQVAAAVRGVPDWSAATLEATVREYVAAHAAEGLKLGQVAQPIRAALTGDTVSPPVFDVMDVLGRDETLLRIEDALSPATPTH